MALSRSYLQEAMSPAPTSVTVVCPTPGAAVSTAVVQANSTAKAIEASSKAGFFIFAITFRWRSGESAVIRRPLQHVTGVS